MSWVWGGHYPWTWLEGYLTAPQKPAPPALSTPSMFGWERPAPSESLPSDKPFVTWDPGYFSPLILKLAEYHFCTPVFVFFLQ